ncbi:DNA-directed RNA polymerases II, IV and V subunit 3-like [Actinidia eriantha]|uniref:DNA-directed RNA polymerases II, IV and V subunit 3-like n=1 Tax=Actinidia eriantha TaxID=165200 RepID=UPI00258ABD4A|nr:DNA-directed RNA polymerases II, IV and V subunit 3-like [Actinidia eriantha]
MPEPNAILRALTALLSQSTSPIPALVLTIPIKEAMGKPGLVEINAKEDSFIFIVESTGAIKESQLVLNAIEVLKQSLDAVHLSEDTVESDKQFGELGAHMTGG